MSAESSRRLRLEDGRTLAHVEWGDGSGFPLFLHHGSSSSRLEHPLQPEVVEGVPLVTIDRPGNGLSDCQPERTLLDWPDAVAALAEHLGIEQFAVSGWSAGGPDVLACACRIPERPTGVGLISSLGPSDRPGARAGMDRFNKVALAAMLLASMVKSFRAGSDGSAWEARLPTLPSGFHRHYVGVPVALWHGDADISSPLAAATYLSRRIPDESRTIFRDEGQFLILKLWGEIIRQLNALRIGEV